MSEIVFGLQLKNEKNHKQQGFWLALVDMLVFSAMANLGKEL